MADKIYGLTPPNWENEGLDIDLNKRYDEIVQKTFDKYIDDFSKPLSVLQMPDKETGFKIAENLFINQEEFGLNLVRNYNSLIFEIHGTEEGLVAYQGGEFEPGILLQRLEDTGIIPDDIKQIYTSSCYGGLQKLGITEKGIPFESLHTSNLPTWGKNSNKDIAELFDNANNLFVGMNQTLIDSYQDSINSYTKILSLYDDNDNSDFVIYLREEINKNKKALAEEQEKLVEHHNEKHNRNKRYSVITNTLDNGVITDKYKQEVIENFQKYGEKFADASFVATEEEISHALWPLVRPKVQEQADFYGGLIKDYQNFIDSNNDTINDYYQMEKDFDKSFTNEIEKLKEQDKDLKETLKKHQEEQQKYLDIIEANKPYDREDWHVSEEREGKKSESITEHNNKTSKYLTPQEAFDKYGSNSDEFYTSQGLDPKQQREATSKLNSGRSIVDDTPIEVKEFQQKLNNLGITEEEYYNRFNKETIQIINKKYDTQIYVPQRGPKLNPQRKIIESTIEHQDSHLFTEQSINEGIKTDIFSDEIVENVIDNPKDTINKKPNNKKPLIPKRLDGNGGKAINSNINATNAETKISGKISGGKAIGIAAAVIGGLMVINKLSKDNNKKKKEDEQYNYYQTNNYYEQQMAKDSSSYRYGKHMTGFVNF